MKNLDRLIIELGGGTRIQAQAEILVERTLMALGAATCMALIAWYTYRGESGVASDIQNFYDRYFGSGGSSVYVSGDVAFSQSTEAAITGMSQSEIAAIANDFAKSASFTDAGQPNADVFAGDYDINLDDMANTGTESFDDGFTNLEEVWVAGTPLFGVHESKMDDRLSHFADNADKANKNRIDPENEPPEGRWKVILTAGTSAVATKFDQLARIIGRAYQMSERQIVPAAKRWCVSIGNEIRVIDEAITNLINFGSPTAQTAVQYNAALNKTVSAVAKLVRYINAHPEAYRATNIRRVMQGTSIPLPEQTMAFISDLAEWGIDSGLMIQKISAEIVKVAGQIPSP